MNINKSWLILADTIRYQTVAFIIIVPLQWFIIQNQMDNLPPPRSGSLQYLHITWWKRANLINGTWIKQCSPVVMVQHLWHSLLAAQKSSLPTDVHWHTKSRFTVVGWRRSSTISFFCFQCSWLNWQTNFKEDLAYWQ